MKIRFIESILVLTIFCLAPLSVNAATEIKLTMLLRPGGPFYAVSNTVEGNASKKAGGFTAKDIKLNLTTLKTDNTLRDKHMKEKYFEVAKYPTAVLLEASGEGGSFTGKLKVHGKVQDISGSYTINGKELTATFKTTMSGYGIAKASYLGVGVKDDVDVSATIPLN